MVLFDNLRQKWIDLKNEEKIGIYVCGPTVYDYSHIGHGRSQLTFDFLYRILKHNYPHREIYLIQNITDIDDKIIKKAKSLKQSPKEIATYYEDHFLSYTCKLLNIVPAKVYPRVTDHIKEIIQYIEVLLQKNNAYIKDGSVYFDLKKFEKDDQFTNFKSFAHIPDIRVENKVEKKYWKDFCLWKKSQIGYISPWGTGKPGWHIECSAMSYKYLGESFTIHGGGSDLTCPHHSNEIWQSWGRFNKVPAKVWIHNGLIQVKNTKMSKSLNNFKYLKEFVNDYYTGDIFRYYIASKKYNINLNFISSDYNLSHKAYDTLRTYWFKNHLYDLESDDSAQITLWELGGWKNYTMLPFNTSLLIQSLHKHIKNNNKYMVKKITEILGFSMKIRSTYSREQINHKVQKMNKFYQEKDYESSDDIRKDLLESYIQVQISKNKCTWYFL